MKLLKKTVILSSFVAIASRLVGAAYRVADTLNPNFQQSQVISNPKTVFRREAMTIGMGFGVAFLTNHFLEPLVKRKGWNWTGINFFTIVLSTFIAETVARHFAYRIAPLQQPSTPRPLPQNLRPSPFPPLSTQPAFANRPFPMPVLLRYPIQAGLPFR